MRELLGSGRLIGLCATDTGDRWVLDLLLVLYRRVPVTDVEVTGDAGLVDFWLERVGFG